MSKRCNDIVLKYFILPLYDISFKQVEKVYVDVYLKKEGTFIFLEVNNMIDFTDNVNWRGISNIIESREFHIFETPNEFINDILLLISVNPKTKEIESKYSKMSNKAKSKIVQLSGLKYKELQPDKTYFTSYPLMALFKFPEWKELKENELGVKLDESCELLDRLTEEIFIENLIEKV